LGDDLFQPMDEMSQNLKIAFLSVATHLGGGEKSLLDLLKGLKEKNCKIVVFFPSPNGPLLEKVRELKISYHIVEMPSLFQRISRDKKLLSIFYFLLSIPSLLIYLVKLAKILKEEKPQIVHTNGIKCHIIGSILTPLLGTSLVWHGRDIFSGFTLKTLRLFSRFTKPWIIFNSRASASAFKNYKKQSVIYNGFELPPPKTAPNLREFVPQPFLFGILGVLADWKGQDIFLELAARMKNENCGFVIIGGRIYDTVSDLDFEKNLHRQAKDIPNVKFMGHVENPIDYLRQIDCLVHCSKRPEPFGRVAVEAQLVGVPVIASKGGGILEIIEENETGFLYPMGNVDSLEALARKVLLDPTLRSKISQRAKLSAEKFSLSSHVSSVLSLYRQLI
jgi:glycosyltransferase involved in cell wall biosynthesis